jgi:hypothetical protein
MRKISLAIAVAVLAGSGCSDEGKKRLALQEIGLQANALMQKSEVPRDQAHFDQITLVVGSSEDPWGNGYVYERLSVRKIKISSKGRDAKLGTPDDVAQEFELPSGSGLEGWSVVRPDGVLAIKSPEGSRTFWVTQRDAGRDQITDYWLGDAGGNAEKPARTNTIDTEKIRRSVSLRKWSNDGRYLTFRESDSPTRPDGNDTKETLVTLDTTNGQEIDAATLPADMVWTEY